MGSSNSKEPAAPAPPPSKYHLGQSADSKNIMANYQKIKEVFNTDQSDLELTNALRYIQLYTMALQGILPESKTIEGTTSGWGLMAATQPAINWLQATRRARSPFKSSI